MKIQFILLCVLLASWQLHAEENGDTSPPTEKPAAPLEFKAEDTSDIWNAMGKEAVVEGTILNAFWVRDNVLMLTFREEKDGFIAVSFAKYREKLDASFNGDITEALKGRTVKISGELAEFNSRPQIVVRSDSQIEILETKPAKPPE